MRTIIFPTDFTPTSENAEMYAIDLAKYKKAKIFLVHVEENDEYFSSGPFINETISTLGNEELLIKEGNYLKLKSIVKKYKSEKFEHAFLVKKGEVVKTLLNLIVELDADILVMGTNGNENYERSNSNASKIVLAAECSVFTIPKEAKYKKITHIVYATDLMHKDIQAFDHLVKFAKVFNADITLLHINVDGNDIPGSSSLFSIPEIMEMINYDRVESKVIIASSIMAGIERYMEENKVDVLAMTTHSNAFLNRFIKESITEKMVLTSKIPILTFAK